MKIIIPLCGFLLLTCYNTLHAQTCSVTIQGPKCVGDTQVAQAAGGVLAKLLWQKDTAAVYGADTLGSPASTVVVAGGNGYGNAANQLRDILGDIVVDSLGNLYVLDYSNYRVQKWAPGAKTGITVAGGNGEGNALNQLEDIEGLAIDNNGNIYVADGTNNRVVKWAPGTKQGVIVAGGNGDGSAANQLSSPASIFVTANGDLYIADNDNNRVQKWAPNATQGITVAGGHGEGHAGNQFTYIYNICLDKTGNLYVLDVGYSIDQYYRVQKWAPGADSGITIIGDAFKTGVPNPKRTINNLSIDANGNLYSYLHDINSVLKWTPGTTTGVAVAGWSGEKWSQPPELVPGFAIGKTGEIYIADDYKERVLKLPANGIVDNKYVPQQLGIYTVTATFKNGCIASSNPKLVGAPVQLNPRPVTLGANANLCGGVKDTFLVTPDENAVYEWKLPDNVNLIANRNDTIIVNVKQGFTNGAITVAGTNVCGTGPLYSVRLLSSPVQPAEISGPGWVTVKQANLAYHVEDFGFEYTWSTPPGAKIISGQGTANIVVNWGSEKGEVSVSASNACGPSYEKHKTVFLEDSSGCTVNITGMNCTGNQLTANVTGGVLAHLIWKQDKQIVYEADTVRSQANVSVVAVGNDPYHNNVGNGTIKGITVDKTGNVYITQPYINLVQKWAPGATAGVHAAGSTTGIYGDGAGELDFPFDVFVDKNSNLYIADLENNRIQKWAPGAAIGTTVAGGNGRGTTQDKLKNPNAVCVDDSGNVYVSDRDNYRVQKWAPNAKKGITVAGGHGHGHAANQLYNAIDIALDGAGNLYILEAILYKWGKFRVQKWVPGADSGVTVIAGEKLGDNANTMRLLLGIDVDSAGNIYALGENSRAAFVQKWQPGAKSGVVVAGNTIKGWDSFRGESSIAVTKKGDIYVAYNKYVGDGPEVLKFSGVTGIVDSTFVPKAAGVYTVKAIFKNGCTTQSGVKVIGQTPAGFGLQPVSEGRASNLCGGTADTFMVKHQSDTISYKWKLPTNVVMVADRNEYIIVNVHKQFTHGTLRVSGANGCAIGITDSLFLQSPPPQPGNITGPVKVSANQANLRYSVPDPGFNCTWQVPAGASIVSGQGSASIIVNWGVTPGDISVLAANDCGASFKRKQAITVHPSLLAGQVNGEASKTGIQNNPSFIYPNPAVNRATILFQASAQAKYTVEVQDVTGKTVLHKETIFVAGANKVDIDVSRYAKGMYVVTVTNAAKQKTSFKLMKQ